MFKAKKKIVAMMVMLAVVLFPMSANANVVDEYYLDYAEPACSETQGYVSLALQNDRTGYIDIFTFFWNSVALDDNVQQPCMMYIDIVGNGVIYFSPYVNLTYVDSAIYTITRINPDGVFVPYYPSTGASTKVSWNFSMDGYTFIGMKYGGNVIGDYAQEQYYNFALYFATDGTAQQLMQLQQQLQMDELEDILAEQKKTNTWLEKILEAINGSSEQQKQEATNQGNSSVSQGEASIEDKGAAFGDGISALTSSMSYTGTECAWQFPQVKLPGIDGVMEEVTLIDSQPIDFSQWVNVIPDDILLVIQSVLTIGLIVYCFKELYSTIAYVLTLRKDDNS